MAIDLSVAGLNQLKKQTALVGEYQYVYKGKISELPLNIIYGSMEMKQNYIEYLRATQKVMVCWQTPPGRLQEVLKEKVMEVLKNIPPDPTIQGIFIVATGALITLFIVLGANRIAKL